MVRQLTVDDIQFKNKFLLDEALTHRSYAHVHKVRDNERLEFLGDSILGLVVSEILMEHNINYKPRDLTPLRSKLVNGTTLADCARRFGLARVIRVHGTRVTPAILEDTLEAFVGALYLDSGLERAKTVVHQLLAQYIDQALSSPIPVEPKNALNRYAQKHGLTLEYVVSTDNGVFSAHALVDGQELGAGSGATRRSAEQAAAADALKKKC